MQRNGEHAAAENDGPSKRLRRPSVRLSQPYYVNPSQVTLQKKWDAFKKDYEGAKKAKSKRNVVDDLDDDLAIGSWKGLKMKGKRKKGEDQEKEESLNSNGSGSDQDWEKGDESEEEESFGADGVNKNFEIEKSEEFRRSLSGDDSGKEGKEQMAVANGDGIRGVGEARETSRPKGVKVWLNELGLGKYESLFEVHEVDEEVLPLLTLEDLKDMGIDAVGSRRKMFCSIQKLGKGFA